MVDFLASLFVCESGILISSHYAVPRPLPHFTAEVSFPAFAHLAASTEGL